MTEQIEKRFSKQTMIWAIALILIAAFSFFFVSKFVTTPEFTASTVSSLDEKKATVMKLVAAAAASSTALSFIPGDATTPIANQIAGLTSYFIVILAAILLEKMLIGAVGYVVFTYLIPAACILGMSYLFIKKDIILILAIKLALFGVVLFAAIPASVHVSDLIYDSYQVSIDQTLETAEQNKEFIEEKKKELSADDQNWMGKIGEYLTDFTSKIGADLSAMVKKGEDTLAAFLEAVAVLIVTSCVIPIVVILIFAWAIKILFGFDIKGVSTIVRKEAE